MKDGKTTWGRKQHHPLHTLRVTDRHVEDLPVAMRMPDDRDTGKLESIQNFGKAIGIILSSRELTGWHTASHLIEHIRRIDPEMTAQWPNVRIPDR